MLLYSLPAKKVEVSKKIFKFWKEKINYWFLKRDDNTNYNMQAHRYLEKRRSLIRRHTVSEGLFI